MRVDIDMVASVELNEHHDEWGLTLARMDSGRWKLFLWWGEETLACTVGGADWAEARPAWDRIRASLPEPAPVHIDRIVMAVDDGPPTEVRL